ncbi:hypothetical protein [Arcticibacter sp. MXS-1]|uniref:hypothetical protein n=1 Tax=Arcticibacter sp. MXS-1 TaxID=3341726 RepID=UPI0035A91CBC
MSKVSEKEVLRLLEGRIEKLQKKIKKMESVLAILAEPDEQGKLRLKKGEKKLVKAAKQKLKKGLKKDEKSLKEEIHSAISEAPVVAKTEEMAEEHQ